VPGRRSQEEITLYKSLGHIVQDLAAVSYLHARAGSVDHEREVMPRAGYVSPEEG
jgi:ornithine cyclodeaminase/alanine dehydrogenase-like protein (mu-crystallin family)